MEIRLKEIMDSKGMKSVELAARLGVTKQTISNMLNGRVMPSIETINKIADILEVPMWQIFADPEEVCNTQPSQDELTIRCDKCGNVMQFKKVEK
jgi:transcriptional regulator with XRE-family HTH domain